MVKWTPDSVNIHVSIDRVNDMFDYLSSLFNITYLSLISLHASMMQAPKLNR